MGVPPVLILILGQVSPINHPFWWYPHGYGTPHIISPKSKHKLNRFHLLETTLTLPTRSLPKSQNRRAPCRRPPRLECPNTRTCVFEQPNVRGNIPTTSKSIYKIEHVDIN